MTAKQKERAITFNCRIIIWMDMNFLSLNTLSVKFMICSKVNEFEQHEEKFEGRDGAISESD